ncbi:MAG TPA: Ppx/GppA phosphatase family protein [Polyangia bacterium]|jgi:exopolyphosphatase/guanosine-5'-triphosphate,3'-diphosphate pyrophosphatase
MSSPIAAIDVGTNTTLLLVARARPGGDAEVLEEAAEITRLGRGIGTDGKLGRDGIERTLAVLRRYAAIAAKHGASLAAIGTEALRRAPNAADFLVPAAEILGQDIEVIGGEREANLTFRAVAASFPDAVARGRVAMVDIGGGSTELIVSENGEVLFRHSFPLGSVRLHERHVHHDPVTADEVDAIDRDVAATLVDATPELTRAPLNLLVGVAGTVTSLAAMAMNLATYDPDRVHGSRLSTAALDAQIARLRQATQDERERMVGLDPRRADVILAGALLLRGIVGLAGVPEVTVSDRGIRWGLFFERAAAA